MGFFYLKAMESHPIKKIKIEFLFLKITWVYRNELVNAYEETAKNIKAIRHLLM